MTSRRQLLSTVLVTVVTAGCGASPAARFYTLAATATAPDQVEAGTDSAAKRYAVVVGPVSIPGEVDRPQFVVHVAANRVALDEFNRWAAPLNDGIARAVAGNLSTLLATPDVATASLANFNAAYAVNIDVQRFDSTPGESALLDAVWTVRGIASGTTRAGRSVVSKTVSDKGFEALAATHSQLLATMSNDIAAAIRAVAESESATPHPDAAKSAAQDKGRKSGRK